MGQDQRRRRTGVIARRAQTDKANTKVECGRQEGHQRSHEEALGVETGRSEEVASNRGEEDSRQEANEEDARDSEGSRNGRSVIDL